MSTQRARKTQTQWDLTLLYNGLDDERIERDVRKTERAYARFARDFSQRDAWLSDPLELLLALERYEALSELPGERALYYAYYVRELDAHNSDADALIMQLSDRLTKAGTLVLFFETRLSKLARDVQRTMLTHPELKKYRYYLKQLFATGKHTLSESEERILALTAQPRSGLWTSGVEKLINKQNVMHDGKTLPLNDALSRAPQLHEARARRALHRTSMEKLREISDFPESEINAIYTNKKISDELRGYREPYDATVLHYENSPKTVSTLTMAVTARFDLSARFMQLKRDLLKLKTLTYADRSAPLGRLKRKVSFSEAVSVVGSAFERISPRYREIFDTLLHSGQVDVYPREGKAGGAYCSGGVNMPTFLLLNHTDDLNSLYTLAHEMGHAIHTERSKSQPTVYQGYSTAVAETASTFFERVVFEDVYETLSEKERIIALHNKIQDDVATVFRQIAFFNFEYELHALVRERGWVSKEEIAQTLVRHLQSYLGEAVRVDELDGYSFVHIGHFRRHFYVYSYAFGQLISSALYERYRRDPSFIEKIDTFLSAGGSDTPERIFKKLGVDITQERFWHDALRGIERDINRLEEIVNK